MGRIIALPYPKNLINLSTGKTMLNKFVWWIWIRNLTYLFTWHLKINECCKLIKVDQNITCISFKRQLVYAHVLTFQQFKLEN